MLQNDYVRISERKVMAARLTSGSSLERFSVELPESQISTIAESLHSQQSPYALDRSSLTSTGDIDIEAGYSEQHE